MVKGAMIQRIIIYKNTGFHDNIAEFFGETLLHSKSILKLIKL